jgi:hypothetical protein
MVEEGALVGSAVGLDMAEDVQGIDMVKEGSIFKGRGEVAVVGQVAMGPFRESSEFP